MSENATPPSRPNPPGAVLFGSVVLWALAFVFMSLCASGEDTLAGCAATLLIGSLFAYQAMAVLRGDRFAVRALKNTLLLVGVAQIVFGAVLGAWFVGLSSDLFRLPPPDLSMKFSIVAAAGGFAAICWTLWFGLRQPRVEAWLEAAARRSAR